MLRQPALALLAVGLLVWGCAPPGAPVEDTEQVEPTKGAHHAELGRPASLALTCGGCHSAGGDAIKSIDGYTAEAIRTALERYKLESEGTTVMHRLVRGYSDADIQDISAYLGKHGEVE